MSVTFVTNEDMAVIDKKVDKLLQNASFRIEHGSEFGCEEILGSSGVTGYQISIPCSANPKLIIFKATEATQATLVSLTRGVTESPSYAFALIFNNVVDLDHAGDMASAARNVAVFQYQPFENGGYAYVVASCTDAKMLDVDTVPKTNIAGFYQGDDAEYEWTAYYWDE